MKKNVLLLAALLVMVVLQAQDSHKVFSSLTLGWFGVDFRNAKMIGFGDESPHKIKDEYFKAWNEVTVEMDLAKMFEKKSAFKDPNGTQKENLARETQTMKSGEDVEMDAARIAEITKTVPVGSKKQGLGLVFIAQSFNKTSGVATVHVTFFDIATKEVLWTKKMTGKAGSGDPKKAWAAAIKDIFSQIEKKEYKNWRKEANY